VAAIFDFDRTLIPGASGPILQRHLKEAGVGRGDSPLLAPFMRLYERAGENWLQMQAARLAAPAARGRPTHTVARAPEAASEELVDLVQPYAVHLFEEHRAAGRRLVMASTTPEVLLGPLARRLGFDHLIATRWRVDGDHFAGGTEGPLCWGRAKLLAVRRWAKEEGVSLRKSWAYSDSFYDGGLLAAVGNPVAINPDARLAALARLQGWPIRHLDVAPGVVKIAGRELQEWLRPLNRPELVPYARFDIKGVENVPRRGPCILVFNHRSYFDGVPVNLVIAQADRNARFLGKKEVFDAPVIGRVMKAFGGIRVVRASGSDEPLDAAAEALRAGELISMAPQGTIPRGPAFFDPELKARWGAARLAAETRAPVIPLGLWGTEKVWPRSARIPVLNTSDPPVVQATVGPPVELGYEDPEEDTRRIMSAISALLPEESRHRHEPTEAELALTYPPGYKGNAGREVERRPGTDT
jgi:putative phosphoserine phosphatase/1-acylglycerol-3-phosphate O-acyltransferase